MSVKTILYKNFDSMQIKESTFREFNLPEHFHDEYCIGLLSKGIKSTVVEGAPYLIHANAVSIVNPYQIHADRNLDTDICHYRMIYINKEVVNYFAKQVYECKHDNLLFINDLIVDPLVSNAILDFFSGMNDEQQLENKLSALIELLVTRYTLKPSIEINNGIKNAINDSIEKARAHFSDKIDIYKMVAECKLSKFQFIRYFKKMTGLTPAVYILINRINQAKTLLSREIPITQVALEVGFYDHPQFCKFFKYYTNSTPSEYKSNCNIIQA